MGGRRIEGLDVERLGYLTTRLEFVGHTRALSDLLRGTGAGMSLGLDSRRRRLLVLLPSWRARSQPFSIWGLYFLPWFFLIWFFTPGWKVISYVTTISLIFLMAWWRSDVVIIEADAVLVGRASTAAFLPAGELSLASVKAFRSSFPTRGRFRLIPRERVIGFAARLHAGQLAVCVALHEVTSAGQSEDGRPLVWLPIPQWQMTRPAELVILDATNLNAAWEISDPPDNEGSRIEPDPGLLEGGDARDFGWIAVDPEGLSYPSPGSPEQDVGRVLAAWADVAEIRDGQHSESIAQAGSYEVWDLLVELKNGDTLAFTPDPIGASREALAFVVTAAAARGVPTHVTGLLPPGSRHAPMW